MANDRNEQRGEGLLEQDGTGSQPRLAESIVLTRLLHDIWIPTMDGYVESSLVGSLRSDVPVPAEQQTSAPARPVQSFPAVLENYALWHRINLALKDAGDSFRQPSADPATTAGTQLLLPVQPVVAPPGTTEWDGLADRALSGSPLPEPVGVTWEYDFPEHVLSGVNLRVPERDTGNLMAEAA